MLPLRLPECLFLKWKNSWVIFTSLVSDICLRNIFRSLQSKFLFFKKCKTDFSEKNPLFSQCFRTILLNKQSIVLDGWFSFVSPTSFSSPICHFTLFFLTFIMKMIIISIVSNEKINNEKVKLNWRIKLWVKTEILFQNFSENLQNEWIKKEQ